MDLVAFQTGEKEQLFSVCVGAPGWVCGLHSLLFPLAQAQLASNFLLSGTAMGL